jgi:hypothetical protein
MVALCSCFFFIAWDFFFFCTPWCAGAGFTLACESSLQNFQEMCKPLAASCSMVRVFTSWKLANVTMRAFPHRPAC